MNTGFKQRHQETGEALILFGEIVDFVAVNLERRAGRAVAVEDSGPQVRAGVILGKAMDGQFADTLLAVDRVGAGIRLLVVAADEQLGVGTGHRVGGLVVGSLADGPGGDTHMGVRFGFLASRHSNEKCA